MKQELKKRILSSLILIPLSFFFIIKSSKFFIFFLSIIFLISVQEWIMMVKGKKLKIIGVIFLLLSLYSSYYIRDISLIYFLILIIICISTDIGGYIFGRVFKGPKLTKISPNKTYSGMLGGFSLAIIFSYLFDTIYGQDQIFSNNFTFLISVILISCVSQIGDLIISYYKRLFNVKDTGKIIPGHGGMLDRIDGMIFVFPFVYIFMILQ